MKRALIISTLIIITNISCSQNKLDRIFGLRLGMSEKELKEVVDTSLLQKSTDAFAARDYSQIEEGVLKAFYMDKYYVDQDYVVEKITLSFFHDKLYSIKVLKYNLQTEKFLALEYGHFSNEYDEEEGERNVKWITYDLDIMCTSFYKIENNKIESYRFYLINTKIMEQMINQFENRD